MKFSRKIDAYKSLSGVPSGVIGALCHILQTRKSKTFSGLQIRRLSRDRDKYLLLADKCCYLTLCQISKSRKLPKSFYSNFSILWSHFCLIYKMRKWKGKNWRHIFFESFLRVLSKCKNALLLIWWSYGTPFGWQIVQVALLEWFSSIKPLVKTVHWFEYWT